MLRTRFALALAVLLALVSAPVRGVFAGPAAPETPKHPVKDVYHGVEVVEDYRWLEAGTSDVKAWSDAQNEKTRAYLDSFPAREAILDRVDALTQSISPLYYLIRARGGVLFALKDQPPKQQTMLVTIPSARDTSTVRVLVDPNVLDPSGSTSIDFYIPSLDGRKVAVSLSKNGTESGTVVVYDVATGERLPDEVPGVNGGTAGGSVAWNADGTGFWHTRYPAPGERPEADLPFYQQVYFHRLGTKESEDRYVVGKEFPKIAEIEVETSDDGAWLLADVRNGDGGQHGFWLAKAGGSFREIARFDDEVVKAQFGGDALYLLSRHQAPNGKILRLALVDALSEGALARARALVPEGPTAIDDYRVTRSRLYVRDIVGGPSEVRVFELLSGKLQRKLALPPISSVGSMVHTRGDELLLLTRSYTEPDRWWVLDPATGRLEATPLQLRSPADYSDTEVRREIAISADGTKVPINILLKKGTKLDGSAPCILYGYGGYGLSQQPSFSASRRLWVEQGGVFAIANIRGGGEFGEAWHRAGYLTKKQNGFDDFAACAKWLVDHKYTSVERLALQGGSNGGILMGAMITQHPERFRAAISSVGVYDMLRVEKTPNGAFNVTEYGTVENPEQFQALRAYSPYHNVKDGVKYPAVLMPTGANDPRVDPWHSRKMVARLQAASTSDSPILLRTSATTGHGGGTPRTLRNAQLVDQYVFLFKVMGISYRASGKALP